MKNVLMIIALTIAAVTISGCCLLSDCGDCGDCTIRATNK